MSGDIADDPSLEALRAREIEKYQVAYKQPEYRMGHRRFEIVKKALLEIPTGERGSLLDVSTGRGETLIAARAFGWTDIGGTEVVDALLKPGIVKAFAWALPFVDRGWQTVCCLDVMEHLLDVDSERTVRELGRVASSRVLLTISNLSSSGLGGVELHITRRAYKDWDNDIRKWLPEFAVEWRHDLHTAVSEMWVAVRK